MSAYSTIILDYFAHLDHAGDLALAENIYVCTAGDEEQGDIITLFIKVAHCYIELTRFQCYGGVVMLAASEYICRWLEGKTISQAQQLAPEKILAALQLSPFYIHIAVRLTEIVHKLLVRVV